MNKQDRVLCYIAANAELALYSVPPIMLCLFIFGYIDSFFIPALVIGVIIHLIIFCCWLVRTEEKGSYFPPEKYMILRNGGKWRNGLIMLSMVSFVYWLFTYSSF
ncbi:hypothetical protein [Risungbinella massiliensis]|uniref:hypothetical protein n=1 Tax=Risungbinella massiliensis TaxID=1329796 RepID=UPI0005CBDDF1|nr:hypothetical protein [Risungbinella massiliensis]